jgi:hypothetical protein
MAGFTLSDIVYYPPTISGYTLILPEKELEESNKEPK